MEEHHLPRKEGKKRFLQKVAKITSIIFFIIAVPCGIATVMLDGATQEVMKASFGAITFFCFTAGIVLKAMADANLPDLSLTPEGQDEQNIQETQDKESKDQF